MQDTVEQQEQTEKPTGVRLRIDHRTGKTLVMQPASFWAEHEQRRLASGMSIAQYCEEHALALSTFRRWSARLASQVRGGDADAVASTSSNGFLAMPIRTAKPQASGAGGEAQVQIEASGGLRVCLHGEAAARVLEAVIARLGSAP